MNTAAWYLNTKYQNLSLLEESGVIGLGGNQINFFTNPGYNETTFQLYENCVTRIDFSDNDGNHNNNNMFEGNFFDCRNNDTGSTYGNIYLSMYIYIHSFINNFFFVNLS